jgi:hypothetical protein
MGFENSMIAADHPSLFKNLHSGSEPDGLPEPSNLHGVKVRLPAIAP